MRRTRAFVVAVLAALAGAPSLAADLACPPTLDVAQHAPNVPPGWSLSQQPGPPRLAEFALYDGPPGEGAELRPDDLTGQPVQRAGWTLNRANPRAYWLQCRYEGSRLVLERRIEPAPVRCEAWYSPRQRIAGQAEPLRFSCR